MSDDRHTDFVCAICRRSVADLAELRAGKISVNDAVARSLLAKQIFNGVRIYLNGAKLLSNNARAIASGIEAEGHDRADGHGAEHESPTAESGDAQGDPA